MREHDIVKFLKKALKEDHLYSNDELAYMKKELASLESQIQQLRKSTSKGFGN